MAKTKRKSEDEKTQKERFIEKARELETDETGKSFERAFKQIVPERKPKKK